MRAAAAFVLLLAVVVAVHVTEALSGLLSRYGELQAIAHVTGFTMVTLLAGGIVRRADSAARWGELGRLAAAVLAAAAIALAAEAAQGLTGRDASVSDLVRDACGIAAGVGLLLAFGRDAAGRRWWLRAVFVALTVAALAPVLRSPGTILVSRLLAYARFPVLADFEQRSGARNYAGSGARVAAVPAPPGWPVAGSIGLVEARAGAPNPGVSFRRFPGNWARYRALSFLVASAGPKGGELTIRIHDRRHDYQYADRFNRAFTVGPEPRRIHVDLDDVRKAPRGRVMDMSAIEQVIIFDGSGDVGEFLLDDLRLE